MTNVAGDCVGEGSSIALTADEREEVRAVLESAVRELDHEIRHTDGYEFRNGLKGRRAVLARVLRRLAVAPGISREGHTEGK